MLDLHASFCHVVTSRTFCLTGLKTGVVDDFLHYKLFVVSFNEVQNPHNVCLGGLDISDSDDCHKTLSIPVLPRAWV